MSYLTNPARYSASDYPQGVGATGDGIVTWDTTRTPNRQSVQLASNLPAYSWHFAGDDAPTITTGFTENMGNKFSFSGWVRPDVAVSGTAWKPILGGKGANDPTEEWSSYWVGYATNGAFGGEALGDESLRTVTTAPATDSNNHVAYTIDGDAGEYYCWVNGVQHAGYPAGSVNSGVAGTEPLTVGTNWTSVGYDRYFYGYMQQYLYYNRVLTDAEIGLLYGSGSGIAIPDTSTTLQDELRIFFDFQDVTGVDASGVQKLINRAIP